MHESLGWSYSSAGPRLPKGSVGDRSDPVHLNAPPGCGMLVLVLRSAARRGTARDLTGRHRRRRIRRRQVRRARALVQVPRFDVLEVRNVLFGEDLVERRRPAISAGDRVSARAVQLRLRRDLSPVFCAASAPRRFWSTVMSGWVYGGARRRLRSSESGALEIIVQARIVARLSRATNCGSGTDSPGAARRRTGTRSSARPALPRETRDRNCQPAL